MWNDRFIDPCSIARRACFDPASLTVAALASSAVAAGTSVAGGVMANQGAQIAAQGTIAGGNAALQAGQMQQSAADYQAAQLTQNAGQAFAAGQRQSLNDQENARLAISTARAGAAAGGTNAGVGSPVSVVGSLARRGSYNAALDMFNGASTETGLINEAKGVSYSGEASLIGGEESQAASRIAAAATIAGGTGSELAGFGAAAGDIGSMAKTYGGYAYPQYFRTG